MQHTHVPKQPFLSNPFSVLIAGGKALLVHSTMLSLLVILLPLGLGFANFFFQLIIEVATPSSDNRALEGDQIVFLVVAWSLYAVVQVFVQLAVTGLGCILGLAVSDKKEVSPKSAFDELLRRFWRFTLLQIRIFLFALPYLLLLIGLIFGSIVVAVNNPGTTSLILPLAVVTGVILVVMAVRVYMRYSLSAFVFFDINNHGIKESMRQSKALTSRRLIELFSIISFSSWIPVLSVVISPASLAFTYRQRQEYAGKHLSNPHWLNYLIVIIMALGAISLLLLIALFTALFFTKS